MSATEKASFEGVSYHHAAEILGVNVQFIRKLVKTGHLPAHRLGHNTTRVNVADIQALLEVTRIAGDQK